MQSFGHHIKSIPANRIYNLLLLYSLLWQFVPSVRCVWELRHGAAAKIARVARGRCCCKVPTAVFATPPVAPPAGRQMGLRQENCTLTLQADLAFPEGQAEAKTKGNFPFRSRGGLGRRARARLRCCACVGQERKKVQESFFEGLPQDGYANCRRQLVAQSEIVSGQPHP